MNNWPNNYGFPFVRVFPNFEEFVRIMTPKIGADTMNDALMPQYFTYLYSTYFDRYFKWNTPYVCADKIAIDVKQSFQKFKIKNAFLDLTLSQLADAQSTDFLYGLPGDETAINETNESNYLKAKSSSSSKITPLQVMAQFDAISDDISTIFRSKNIAGWFIAYTRPENGTMPI